MVSENSLKEIANSIMRIHQRDGKIPQNMTADLLKGLNELNKINPKAVSRVKKYYEGLIAAQHTKQVQLRKTKKKTQKKTTPKKVRRRL